MLLVDFGMLPFVWSRSLATSLRGTRRGVGAAAHSTVLEQFQERHTERWRENTELALRAAAADNVEVLKTQTARIERVLLAESKRSGNLFSCPL